MEKKVEKREKEGVRGSERRKSIERGKEWKKSQFT